MPRTKTDDVLRAAEIHHAHDPERSELIARVRRFKASWFELGESLTEVKRAEGFKKWGYASFEDYCAKELHLKRDTADKLTGSFAFLRKSAPEMLRRDGRDGPIPNYQAVDFLRRAEEEATDVPAETLTELRRHVLEEGATLPKVTRLFREAVFPADVAEQSEKRLSNLSSTISRLVELLAHARADKLVPEPLCAEIEEPLARLAEHLGRKAAAA
jgi:hypothetical protein